MTEKEYQFLLSKQKDWKYYNNFTEYLLEHTEESGDYLPLQPCESNTIGKLYLDSCRSFVFNNHPMWLYVECKISKDIDVIPISISFYPQVLCNIKLNEKQNKVVESAKKFIINYTPLLTEYARENIDIINFFNVLKNKRQILSEDLLIEMPVLQSDITGLPTDIWVDNNRNKQHANRIKFNDKGSKHTREWASMTIDSNNPIVMNLSKNTKLSSSDIDKIKQFVVYNYDILNRLSTDPLMNYEKEFIPYMFKMKGDKGYSIPIKRAEQAQEDMTHIECFIRSNRLYFLTGNERFVSSNFINYILQDNLFKKQDDYTAYVELSDNKSEAYNIGVEALNKIKLIAKTNNMQIKIHNSECIYDMLL